MPRSFSLLGFANVVMAAVPALAVVAVDAEGAETRGDAHTSSGVSLSWLRRFSSSHLSACAGT